MVVEGINLNQPLQKDKIKLFLKKQNLEFFEKANKYLNALYTVANKKLNYTPNKFVNSYVDFCKIVSEKRKSLTAVNLTLKNMCNHKIISGDLKLSYKTEQPAHYCILCMNFF